MDNGQSSTAVQPLKEGNAEVGDWSNELHLATFRHKFFARVYGFFIVQFALVALITYSFSCRACFVVSYLVLYIPRFNHPEKKVQCALMQVQFTLFMSVACALVCVTFDWYSLPYAAIFIGISSAYFFAGYFFKLDFHDYHGLRFVFSLQCLVTGLFMLLPHWQNLWKDSQGRIINHSLEGFIIASLVIVYFAVATSRMSNMNQHIRYKLDNFFFGATLIYTTPILTVFYKPKKL